MNDQAEIQQQDPTSSSHKSPIEALLKELASRHLPEEKIQCALLFMESAIAREGGADFKAFWEARKCALSFFREAINPPLRNDLWAKLSDLSKEARRLKDIADEQSSFATEQIEMAIQSIEKDLADSQALVTGSADLPQPEKARVLISRWSDYNAWQKELDFLNAYASRINGLRKELIKTEMRIRIKNQLFDRLSKAGDLLFPRRKELIQLVSDSFQHDVEQFATRHFGSAGSNVPTFALRDEIKEMQNLAKLFTLNAKAFSNTRMKLSACWDSLKEKDVERRKEFEEKKGLFEENAKAIGLLLEQLEGQFAESPDAVQEHESRLSEILQEMRRVELGRDEVKTLRTRVDAFKAKLHEKELAAEAARKQAEIERQQKRRELIDSFRTELDQLFDKVDVLSLEEMQAMESAVNQRLAASSLNRTEKAELEKRLKPLKEIAKRKKEAALLALPPDALAALDQLNELMESKLEERLEVKALLEDLRKKSKASGLDFNRALEFNEQISEENARLKEIVESIDEIKGKIEELKTQIE